MCRGNVRACGRTHSECVEQAGDKWKQEFSGKPLSPVIKQEAARVSDVPDPKKGEGADLSPLLGFVRTLLEHMKSIPGLPSPSPSPANRTSLSQREAEKDVRDSNCSQPQKRGRRWEGVKRKEWAEEKESGRRRKGKGRKTRISK